MKCLLCESDKVTEKKIGQYTTYCCENCKLQFVNDFGDEHEYHKNYFERFRFNEEKLNLLREQQYEIDAKHLSSWISAGNVLDIGCSRGQFMNVINKYGNFNKLVGIDIDESAIAHAKSLSTESKFEFYDKDMASFDSQEQFDAAVFRGTFQYMSTALNDVCAKLTKVVKKDGLIIIYSLPNADSFVFKIAGENWVLFNPKEHKLFFNEASINFLAQKHNFVIEDIRYPYLDTPYANLEKDYNAVIDMIKNGTKASPAFWGNIMQLVIRVK